MKIPCVMLAREGSKRLPWKNRLDWFGLPLWRCATVAAANAESVSSISIVSDMPELHPSELCKGWTFRDKTVGVWPLPMPDNHTSIEGVNWWREQAGLEASYVMLIQCTNPFINAADLDKLVEIAFADGPPTEVWALGSRGRPNGMAWIIPPMATDTIAKRFVEPDVWGVDIDTREDYERALEMARE